MSKSGLFTRIAAAATAFFAGSKPAPEQLHMPKFKQYGYTGTRTSPGSRANKRRRHERRTRGNGK